MNPFDHHGTDSTYSNHKCRCIRCRAAHAKAVKKYRDANREKWYPRHLAQKRKKS